MYIIHRTARRFAAIATVILLSPALAAGSDMCSDPELLRVTKGAECRSESIRYRENQHIRGADLAIVTAGLKRDYDHIYPAFIYFLRVHEDAIVALDAFPPAASHAPFQIYEQLGYNVALGGGQVRTSRSLFYDRLVEKISGRYCMVYQMKPPFTGEFHDCDGQGSPGGRVGYVSGTVTATDAKRRICDFVAAETSQPCGNNSVEVIGTAIQRDVDGRMYYRVISRRRIRDFPELEEKTSYGSEVPVEYELRTYRLDADNGAIALLSQPLIVCNSCKASPASK